MKFSRVEKIGFISTWIILIGYLFIKINLLEPTGLIYQSINLVGALGIVYVSVKKHAKQPAVLNVIWALIAFAAIGRYLL